MKTIAVLGANGRTGIEIVKQALEKGWVVKALVRDKQKIKLANPIYKSLKEILCV